VRTSAAPEPRVHHHLGGPFDLDGFYAFAESDPEACAFVAEPS
jgi:hypothetical protein